MTFRKPERPAITEESAWANHRRECEEGVLGGLMADPSLLTEMAAMIDQSSFLNPFEGVWFRLASELYDAGRFTVERLRKELKREGFLLSIDELKQFSDLASCQVSSSAVWYASELSRICQLQSLQRMCNIELASALDLQSSPTEIAARIESKLAGIRDANAKLWEDLQEVGDRVIETHRSNLERGSESSIIGMPTGFGDIDEITGGFFPGQLWQIAARSFMGKTTVALAIAQRQCQAGRGVYYANYEQRNDELMERVYSDLAAIPLEKFTKGLLTHDDIKVISDVRKEISKWRLLLDYDRPGLRSLKARIKLAQSKGPISLVIIDYLLNVPVYDRQAKRPEQLVNLTREMKALAQDLNIPILVLNQLNADADGEEPNDTHYSESKGVLQNMDVSMLLHRETKSTQKMLCKITKNKKGAEGRCFVRFDGVIQRVEPWVDGF